MFYFLTNAKKCRNKPKKKGLKKGNTKKEKSTIKIKGKVVQN